MEEEVKVDIPAILSERPPVINYPGEQKRCNWCRMPLKEGDEYGRINDIKNWVCTCLKK
jgi:hypothetical protein